MGRRRRDRTGRAAERLSAAPLVMDAGSGLVAERLEQLARGSTDVLEARLSGWMRAAWVKAARWEKRVNTATARALPSETALIATSPQPWPMLRALPRCCPPYTRETTTATPTALSLVRQPSNRWPPRACGGGGAALMRRRGAHE